VILAVTRVKVLFYADALDLFSSRHLSPVQVHAAFILALNIGQLALVFLHTPFTSKPYFPFPDVTEFYYRNCRLVNCTICG
jgi:hypothetical protein